jgi:hypothetical protein
LTASATGAGAGILQCQSNPFVAVATLNWTENFATAFKTRDANPSDAIAGGQQSPGSIYNTESGLIVADTVPGATAPTFGIADLGTRLKVTFAGLPHGITLSVPTVINDTVGGTIYLVSSNNTAGYDDVADSGTFGPPTPLTDGTLTINYASSDVNTGTAAATYEVFAANQSAIDSFPVPITLSFTGAPGTPGSPDIGNTATLIGSFAPTAGGGSFTIASLAGGNVAEAEPYPIPRFVDNTVSTPIFSVSLCQTILLFPYVTDFPGFDTGIAISNTSADPLLSLGAPPQSGQCTVTFYGGTSSSTGFTDTSKNFGTNVPGTFSTNDPAVNLFTTGMIGPGQTWAFSLSGADTTFGTSTFGGFTGYAIATCQFQFAHGYAFVSDYGLRNFAASYLPLIIPDTASPRAPVPNVCSGLNAACLPTGEQLVH